MKIDKLTKEVLESWLNRVEKAEAERNKLRADVEDLEDRLAGYGSIEADKEWIATQLNARSASLKEALAKNQRLQDLLRDVRQPVEDLIPFDTAVDGHMCWCSNASSNCTTPVCLLLEDWVKRVDAALGEDET